jgi:hypothetical protein
VELYGSLSSPALRAGSVNSGPGGGRVGYPTRHGPPLTTSKISSRIKENFDVSTLTEDAMREINEKITLRTRFNSVVTGVPGFIPKAK